MEPTRESDAVRAKPPAADNAKPREAEPNAAATFRGGRYVVQRTLGEGSQGETFQALDTTRGQLVALKRFRVRGARSWKDVELAEREAAVWQLLGLRAREDAQRGRARGVHVGRGQRAALELLRGHVPERADDGAPAAGAEPVAHSAKVNQRERAVGPADHVAGLDVPVDHRRRAPVEVLERRAEIERG